MDFDQNSVCFINKTTYEKTERINQGGQEKQQLEIIQLMLILS